MAPAGVILYRKPRGPTSHDVVAQVRRRLRSQEGRVRVGHAGTLDPFATGLLLVLVGPATRVQRFLVALPKTYRAVARLGFRSDTGDPDGHVEHTGRVPQSLELPTGPLLQRPPAHSAVKVGGERLYRKARRGEPVEGEPRPVSVYRFEQLWRRDDLVGLEIECSAGTYVRQLVAGLGDAYCVELERTRIGPFSLEQADPERILALGDAVAFLPGREVDAEAARRLAHGAPFAVAEDAAASASAPVRLTHDGRLVAIAEPRKGSLRPLVVFPP